MIPFGSGDAVSFIYTNWEGRKALRSVMARRLVFGATDWHPAPQFLLEALDLEKNANRGFALADIDTASLRALPRPPITMIAAVSANGAIGLDGDMPWHLPEDLRHFKETTRGCPVIMGRKTYQSIHARLGRPLPGRTSIVLTRRALVAPEGVIPAGGLDEALALAAHTVDRTPASDVFVIGGAQIYEAMLPRADRLVLTEIAREYPGDAFFPEWRGGPWRETARAPRKEGDLDYAFVTYERTDATVA